MIKIVEIGVTGGPEFTSTHLKIDISVRKCKDKEGLGVRKRINATVKSTCQSSIHVECTVQRGCAQPFNRFVSLGVTTLEPRSYK